MTPNEFRKLALALPEALEGSHMGHADFRVRNKIFATLGPGEEWGMVKLTPAQQTKSTRDEPDVFETIGGAWGRNGATKVWLHSATKRSVEPALIAAWRNTAPKRLVDEYDAS